MPASPGERLERLVEIVRALRAPGGCPWDREQTLASLSHFVIEETYEVVDAIERGDRGALREEIGDLVFEAVFLAQICSEDGDFTVADCLQEIADKLVRRHPHVFGRSGDPGAPQSGCEPPPASPGEVVERWEVLKARERGPGDETQTILSGLPRAMPALLRAYKIGNRVAAVGFDWDRPADVMEKIEEEVAELRESLAGSGQAGEHAREEMGDLLFALANLARKLGIEPEAALRGANDKFQRRFDALENRFAQRGRRLQDLTLDEMEREWQAIKADE
jgi:nucleoside triphosphate diphosphatase